MKIIHLLLSRTIPKLMKHSINYEMSRGLKYDIVLDELRKFVEILAISNI